MIFERTKDWKTVKEIVTHGSVYSHVCDDFSRPKDEWEPVDLDSIWYVLVRDEEELLGLWIFSQENAICWKVHTCLLPKAYGSKGRQAAKAMKQWIWDNTPCLRIITEVPVYNRLALKFAKDAGMEPFGTNLQCFQKDDQLHDVILLGVSK